jgi:protein-S-isoprenylcysteine O-methyltransferase Ste14
MKHINITGLQAFLLILAVLFSLLFFVLSSKFNNLADTATDNSVKATDQMLGTWLLSFGIIILVCCVGFIGYKIFECRRNK